MKNNVIIQLYSLGILIVKVLSLYHIYISSNGEVVSLILLVNLECLSKLSAEDNFYIKVFLRNLYALGNNLKSNKGFYSY